MARTTRDIGPFRLRRTGDVEWTLEGARAPHRAFLSESLVDHLADDGREAGGTARQIMNVTELPDARLVVNTPDAHYGYGAPIGTVFASSSTLSLSVVGVDISCGMAVVATDLVRSDLDDHSVRRELMERIQSEVPMGKGERRDNGDLVRDFRALLLGGTSGLRQEVLSGLRLTPDAFEFEQDLSRLPDLWAHLPDAAIARGEETLGSLGGGNHFLELQSLEVLDPVVASAWGLRPDQVVLMIHSGSRSFGHGVASSYEAGSAHQFRARERAEQRVEEVLRGERVRRCRLERRQVHRDEFTAELDLASGRALILYRPRNASAPERPASEEPSELTWSVARDGDGRVFEESSVLDLSSILQEGSNLFDPRHLEHDLPYVVRPLPGSEVPAPGPSSRELAEGYWASVQAAQNYAVLSRTIMLYRASRVLADAFGEERVAPRLLYDISHNRVGVEEVDGQPLYVHRKGATRAFPGGHPELVGTRWWETGHPVVVPGSMGSFSYLMRARPEAHRSAHSVNHGAGRALSRARAKRELDEERETQRLDALDTLVFGASMDEMPGAYKDIDEVVRVCDAGGLSTVVARCHPLGTLKGDEDPDD